MGTADKEATLDSEWLPDWIGAEHLLQRSLENCSNANGGDDHIDLEALAIDHLPHHPNIHEHSEDATCDDRSEDCHRNVESNCQKGRVCDVTTEGE